MTRAAAGPQVISRLARRRRDPLSTLSTRELEVLALIAEGHSNTAIARRLVIAEAAVGKHVRSILAKLHLPQGAVPTPPPTMKSASAPDGTRGDRRPRTTGARLVFG